MSQEINKGNSKKPLIVFVVLVGLFAIPLIGVSIIALSRNQITPNDEFFDVSIPGPTPRINVDTWMLTVDGEVENKLTFNYDNFTSLESVTVIATVQCVEGPSGTAVWRGVRVKTILNLAGLTPDAFDIVFYAADDYSSSLALNETQQDDVLLAYEMNGEPLPAEQGFPVRVVATNHAGYKWVKWVERIEVVAYDYLGYWESRGWYDNALRAPVNDWVLHALLLSTAFLFGGVSYLSGLKFAKNVEYFKNLPKFMSRKFHIGASLVYSVLAVATFIYWVSQTLFMRSQIFYTFHGIIALAAIVSTVVSLLSGLALLRRKNNILNVWHPRFALLSIYLFFLTIILGFLLSSGVGFTSLRIFNFFANYGR